MKKSRILVVNDRRVPKGGADRVALNMYESFIKNNHDAELFSYLDVEVEEYSVKPYNILKNLFNFKVYRSLRDRIKMFNPDCIIIHSWTKQLSASSIAACYGKNTFIVAHDYFLVCPNGGQYNYKKKESCSLKGGSISCLITRCDKNNMFQKLYRFLRYTMQNIIVLLVKPKIICLNSIQQQMLKTKKLLTYFAPNNIDYMYQSIGSFNGNNVLYIGRPDPEKGVDRLIALAKKVSCKFQFIGINSDDISTIPNNVDCVGWLSPDEIAERLKNARLLVFPSRWLEVDPLVPLEACAFGVPVLCSSENVFADTLRKHSLENYIFHGLLDLSERFLEIYQMSEQDAERAKFSKLYLAERQTRREMHIEKTTLGSV